MTRLSMLASLPLMAACNGADPQDTGRLVDEGPSCDIVLNQTIPADGNQDAYHRGNIEFHLDEADPTAVVVAPFSGSQATLDDGRIIVFTPDVPLDPDTDYTVALDYCHGIPSIDFRTSDLGAAIEEPASLEGVTFRVDLDNGRHLEGEGVSDALESWFNRPILGQVTRADGNSLDLRTAVARSDADDADQDLCFLSFDVTGVDFSTHPFFSFSATDVVIDNYDAPITFRDFHVDGTVAADASWVGGIRFEAILDVRELGEVMSATPETLCELAETMGAPCEACPGDGAKRCVTLSADQMEGYAVNVPLESITETYSHPGCNESAS